MIFLFNRFNFKNLLIFINIIIMKLYIIKLLIILKFKNYIYNMYLTDKIFKMVKCSFLKFECSNL